MWDHELSFKTCNVKQLFFLGFYCKEINTKSVDIVKIIFKCCD